MPLVRDLNEIVEEPHIPPLKSAFRKTDVELRKKYQYYNTWDFKYDVFKMTETEAINCMNLCKKFILEDRERLRSMSEEKRKSLTSYMLLKGADGRCVKFKCTKEEDIICSIAYYYDRIDLLQRHIRGFHHRERERIKKSFPEEDLQEANQIFIEMRKARLKEGNSFVPTFEDVKAELDFRKRERQESQEEQQPTDIPQVEEETIEVVETPKRGFFGWLKNIFSNADTTEED